MTWTGTPGLGSLTMDGELTTALGTITTDQSNYEGTATWNAGGVTFTGVKLNITDTASASASLLMDLQVAGSSRFKVDKTGTITTVAHSNFMRSLAGTANVLTVVQGDNSGAVTPVSAALIGQQYLNTIDNTSFSAVMGVSNASGGNRGFIQGIHGVAQTPAGSTWSTTGAAQHGFIGVLGEAIGSRTDARIWAGNFIARSETVGIADMSGVEIDLDARTAVGNRYGLTIAANATGAVQGTGEDMMIRLINKVGGAQWKHGIVFHSGASLLFPVETTGTLIIANGANTIGTGIDLSALTITNDAFLGPTGLRLHGAGWIGMQEITAPSAPAANNARLYCVDAAGKTQLRVLFASGASQLIAAEP